MGRSLAVALVLLPCVARAVLDTQVHYVMGTYLRISADGGDAASGDAGVLPARSAASTTSSRAGARPASCRG